MSKRNSPHLSRHKLVASPSKHDVFQAIADPTRRSLLKLLADKEMPITAITECFPISRTAVNKHLHVLSEAGLVSSQKVGRETRYKLQPEPLVELKEWLAFFEQYWDEKLSALKNFVEADNDS
ncbi:ArsR/SmtB family transcription factor [Brevibacillus sp. H7]|uniref:ArsR/SmtB family transcription factor n=1 Tax=Brevibacillus sp. H7 TaxID=3349138 RepID=UPI0037F67CEC